MSAKYRTGGQDVSAGASPDVASTSNGGNRAQRRARRRRSRTLVGASLIAFSGLASGYLQMLRPPAAYASVTCTANNEATLGACLTNLASSSGQVTIALGADISLTADLPPGDLSQSAIDLTIDGQGHVISGSDTTGGFLLDAGNPLTSDDTLLMSDLTFVDMYRASDSGSALYLDGTIDSATLQRVTVTSSYSGDSGGAVYASAARLAIRESAFWSNSSSGHGGAVYGAKDVLVFGSSFANNDASDGGGGVYAGDSAYVYSSYFSGNDAGAYGGAIVAYDTNLTVEDSKFYGNQALNGPGGAIYSEAPDTMRIVRSAFYDNVADNGGAIYFRSGSAGSSTQVIDSTFARNSAVDTPWSYGGAVYLGAFNELQISGSTFAANSALYGGSIYAKGHPSAPNDVVEIENSTFTASASSGASGVGGALRTYKRDVTLTFSTVASDDTAVTLSASGDLTAVGSVLQSAGLGGSLACSVTSGVTDDTFAFATDASCTFDGAGSDDTFIASDFALGALADNGGLTDTMLPGSGSVLISGGSPDALGTGVTTDQRGALRAALFTIGSVQEGASPAPGGSNAPVATAGNASASVAAPTATAGGTPTSWVLQAFTIDDTYLIPTDDTCAIGSAAGSCTVTGLTNGQPYKFKATPSNAQGPGRASLPSNVVTPQAPNPNPPTPTPVFPPSAPRDVTAVGGDKSAVVSWREPASSGSFPVSTYRATASPGGQSCLVVAPALTCSVSGLANGTPYTFTVEALNGAGWSPKGGPSNAVTPGGVTPAPAPVPLPGPLTPGESVLQTNGVVDPNVTVDPNTQDNGLQIQGDGWNMDLDGLGPDGKPLNLGPDGSLRLANERDVATEGTGFLPNSEVDLYVDPPVLLTGASAGPGARVGARADGQGIYVGTVRTDAKGSFTGTATLPEDITPGDHVLQAVGYSPSAQSRAMSLGVIVEPWIVLDQGTRKAEGMHDRIRTTGSSGGIDAGVKLTPWIRYAGQGAFKQGVASITVQSDGSFRWTREIKKTKGLTAYVSYVDVESNRVFWAKVR